MMQKLLFAFVLFCSVSFTVKADEVNYYNKSWKEVKEKAKKEKKYIFLDCFTDWCYYCKVMDKETMVDPKVISQLNSNFVSVKMDMEKGEGLKLVKKYHVQGFPTFLFFSPEGELVYRLVGSQNAEEFAKTLNGVADKTKQFTSPGYSASIDLKYPPFYDKLYAGNGKRTIATEKEVNEYLAKQKDLTSEVNWDVIVSCPCDKKYSEYVLKNIDRYRALYGYVSLDGFVEKVAYKKLKDAIKTKNEGALNDAINTAIRYSKEKDPDLPMNYRISFYQGYNDFDNLIRTVQAYVDAKGVGDGSFLNGICWGLYEKKAGKAYLEPAARWMSKVCEKNVQYAYTDTYAALLYAIGDKQGAQAAAEKAIELGKKEGADTKTTEELLNQIKENK